MTAASAAHELEAEPVKPRSAMQLTAQGATLDQRAL
jgi:hypothetical protein